MKHKNDSAFMRAIWFSTYMLGQFLLLATMISAIAFGALGVNAFSLHKVLLVPVVIVPVFLWFAAMHWWVDFCAKKSVYYREHYL